MVRNATYLAAPLVTALQVLVAANRKNNARLAELDQRLSALAATNERGGVKYRGVWGADEHYETGDVVTAGGSAWHSNQASRGVRPGDPSTASRVWQLMVKRGRDGRQDDAVTERVQQLAARVEALERQLKHEPTT
jgi:hypothetical protein